ncbi:MAG: cyclase family protein [Candidatus Dormibacteraeota bacterium]|nr:cyclase family protein [Candidatus Dormibacteraeota bacterium]MBO0762546.1 cyclase family protein [Candidatus Dormibacteraeota bacterium]
MGALENLLTGLADGSVDLVDLTVPLTDRTPIIQLPPPFNNTRGLTLEELSHYDDRGPAWYWNDLSLGEHAGTHFDAPVHWITGRDRSTIDRVPVRHLVAPVVLIDRSSESEANPDFLLEIDDVRAWERDHGPLPEGGWLLYRTGWDRRASDQAAFLNVDDTGSHTPGVSPACAKWLAQEAPILGLGVETVGTDAGMAATFDPPFPCHSFLHGAGKYGLTSLVNLDRVPPTGSVLIATPLPIVGGSGSPARALALVPR